MSDKVTVGDNDYDTEAGDKDLFHIGLAELKSNKAFLMLGVRIRLGLDNVKTQVELEEAAMDLANTAALTNGLLNTVQNAMTTMNATIVELKDTVREAQVMQNEAEDRFIEARKAEARAKEAEARSKTAEASLAKTRLEAATPEWSVAKKIGTGVVALIFVIANVWSMFN